MIYRYNISNTRFFMGDRLPIELRDMNLGNSYQFW